MGGGSAMGGGGAMGGGASTGDGGCPLPPVGPLTHISGTSADEYWVTLDSGWAYHQSSGTWTCLSTSGLLNNAALWADQYEAWIVGPSSSGKPVLHWTSGGSMLLQPTPATSTFSSLWASPGQIWAGTGSIIYSFSNGTTWATERTSGPAVTSLHGGAASTLIEAGTMAGISVRNGSWFDDNFGSAPIVAAVPGLGTGAIALDQTRRTWVDTGSWISDNQIDSVGAAITLTETPYDVFALISASAYGALWRRDPAFGWERELVLSVQQNDAWGTTDGTVLLAGDDGKVTTYHPAYCDGGTPAFADDFHEGLSPAWVPMPAGFASVAGGELRVTPASATGQLMAAPIQLNLHETSVSVQIVQPATTNGTTMGVSTLFTLFDSSQLNQELKIEICCNNVLKAYAGDPATPLPGTGTYQPGSYVRFRETGGNTYFEVAPGSSGPWTPFWTIATLSWEATLDHVGFGTYASGTLTNTAPAHIDNLNRCP
jgi:hypothetical protein